ncbi:hypothetical protein NL676_014436 [Syzygium grande]|nr:hypothetical protein NL676_014436 [Syzygium grande]
MAHSDSRSRQVILERLTAKIAVRMTSDDASQESCKTKCLGVMVGRSLAASQFGRLLVLWLCLKDTGLISVMQDQTRCYRLTRHDQGCLCKQRRWEASDGSRGVAVEESSKAHSG